MSVRLDHGEDTLDEVHEINVTPFIDVMLVLLIIFMVAAPLATVDIAVNLPASTAEPQPRPERPLYLTVKSDLTLALGDDPVSRELLSATLIGVKPRYILQRFTVRDRSEDAAPEDGLAAVPFGASAISDTLRNPAVLTRLITSSTRP